LPLPKPGLAGTILAQELRALLAAPSLWLMLAVLAMLTGYSFIQAVHLYGEASRTALAYPEMAAGLHPLDGVFIPTFGACYLAETLLVPFVAIRLVGLDKQSQTLKLLLQLPCSPARFVGLKGTAMFLAWLTSLVPAALALFFWHHLGGHIFWPEILAILLGHALYVLVIITLSLAAATISSSLPTAAMLCLAVTLGFWALDFAASSQGALLDLLKKFSLPSLLRQCETGLILPETVGAFLALGLFFFLLASIFLHPGQGRSRQIWFSAATLLGAGLLFAVTVNLPGFLDLTETRRHSLPPEISQALRRIKGPIRITLHLRPEDSRRQDLEQGLLARLQRTLPNLQISSTADGQSMFAASGESDYGLIEYEYQGRHDQSYSNSSEEILTILFGLARLKMPPRQTSAAQGYPLVADAGAAGWWFYLVLPLVCLGGFLLFRNGPPFSTMQQKEPNP
jgi:hypothetical protein